MFKIIILVFVVITGTSVTSLQRKDEVLTR